MWKNKGVHRKSSWKPELSLVGRNRYTNSFKQTVVLRNKLGKTEPVDQLNLRAKRKEKWLGSLSATASHFLLLQLSLPGLYTLSEFCLSLVLSFNRSTVGGGGRCRDLKCDPEAPTSAVCSILHLRTGRELPKRLPPAQDLSSNSTLTFPSTYFTAPAATDTAVSVCPNFQSPKLCVLLLPYPCCLGHPLQKEIEMDRSLMQHCPIEICQPHT